MSCPSQPRRGDRSRANVQVALVTEHLLQRFWNKKEHQNHYCCSHHVLARFCSFPGLPPSPPTAGPASHMDIAHAGGMQASSATCGNIWLSFEFWRQNPKRNVYVYRLSTEMKLEQNSMQNAKWAASALASPACRLRVSSLLLVNPF